MAIRFQPINTQRINNDKHKGDFFNRIAEKRSFDDARAKRLEIFICRSDDSTSERSPPACRPSTVNSIQRPAPAKVCDTWPTIFAMAPGLLPFRVCAERSQD